MDKDNVKKYVLAFITRNIGANVVSYGAELSPNKQRIHIVESDFWNEKVYGTVDSLPKVPLQELEGVNGVPVLYGSKSIKRENGTIVLYADLVSGAFFLLSRYEEMIKRSARDKYSRFLAEYTDFFHKYWAVPIVDAYAEYLEMLFDELSGSGSQKYGKNRFSKIYLTHDVDQPFRFYRLDCVFKQWIKNLFHIGLYIDNCMQKYLTQQNDPYDTFDQMIHVDTSFQDQYDKDTVKVIYFIITAKPHLWNNYCPINSNRFIRLLKTIVDSGAELGLHLGLEAGLNSKRISKEADIFLDYAQKDGIKSRHHFLRWSEPEQVSDMQAAGIVEDYTLGYADYIGFRVGTCYPYRYINPCTVEVTNVEIHPLEIMDGTLDSYMGLSKNDAFDKCKRIIDQVYHYGGELDLLWHNTSFYMKNYRSDLYKDLLEYILQLKGSKVDGN